MSDDLVDGDRYLLRALVWLVKIVIMYRISVMKWQIMAW